MREGKISFEVFKVLIEMNTNGNGLDLWLTPRQLEVILAYTNPRLSASISPEDKVDYNALLFCLEKP